MVRCVVFWCFWTWNGRAVEGIFSRWKDLSPRRLLQPFWSSRGPTSCWREAIGGNETRPENSARDVRPGKPRRSARSQAATHGTRNGHCASGYGWPSAKANSLAGHIERRDRAHPWLTRRCPKCIKSLVNHPLRQPYRPSDTVRIGYPSLG